jgi:phosphoenolpyruvate carboxykinase (ATP)
MEAALRAGEGRLGRGGTLLVETGRHTGRSPRDKHVVRSPGSEAEVWWDGNADMAPNAFARLRADVAAHLGATGMHVQDLWAGADPTLRVNVRMVTERAWHALFVRHLLRRPPREALDGFAPDWTVMNAPSFAADPARHGCRSGTVIAIDLEERMVVIAGTEYAGENKKAVFTILNWLLPERGVLPMHCSANHAIGDPGDAAIFFGLSGTGKTTLSADPSRVLLGDDEHGWSDRGLFNFEGGCYAKTLNLSAEAEARDPCHHRALRYRRGEHGPRPRDAGARLRRRDAHGQHALRLSRGGDSQRLPHGPGWSSPPRGDAHL